MSTVGTETQKTTSGRRLLSTLRHTCARTLGTKSCRLVLLRTLDRNANVTGFRRPRDPSSSLISVVCPYVHRRHRPRVVLFLVVDLRRNPYLVSRHFHWTFYRPRPKVPVPKWKWGLEEKGDHRITKKKSRESAGLEGGRRGRRGRSCPGTP